MKTICIFSVLIAFFSSQATSHAERQLILGIRGGGRDDASDEEERSEDGPYEEDDNGDRSHGGDDKDKGSKKVEEHNKKAVSMMEGTEGEGEGAGDGKWIRKESRKSKEEVVI